jgi:serine/threonine protein kinase
MNNISGQNLGRYHIIEPLGQGGMASIFKAYDTTLERYVAIKVIRTDITDAGDAEFLMRFKREARALAHLDHPYILKVLDYGEQDGTPYLVMPFEPGGTLKEKMGQPIPYQQAAVLLAPVARALEYAHQLKIIHRDVKPANILIGHSGTPLLSDFGIAKIIECEDSTQLTATGVGIGTPDYMAPEQWMGNSSALTDIYSLGVVFYEMVTGRRPFMADTPAAVLIKHLQDPLPRPRTFVDDLSDAVELVLFKALAKDPGERYQDMGLFASALEKLATDQPIISAPVSALLQTVQSLPQTLPKAEMTNPTVLASPSAKGAETWKIILAMVAAALGLVLLCALLGGGTFVVSRLVASNRAGEIPTANDPPVIQPTSAPVIIDKATPEPLASNTPVVTESPTQITPFQTIEGYPDDVPLLTDNNGDLMTTINEGATIYSFTSNLPMEKILDFYKSGMEKNKWKLVSESTQNGQKVWNFMKDENRMVMISVMAEKDITRIVVVLVKT